MAISMKKKAEATTTKELKEKGKVLSEETATEKVEVPDAVASDTPSSKPWCEVGVDASYTHNLGNYQSCRVGVSLKVPCLHGEVDMVFAYAQEWVDGKMNGMIADLQKE